MPDDHFHIHFLPVGQGDSALLTFPHGQNIVIDGGPDWTTLQELGKLLPFFDRHIDLLVLSHPNVDHMVSLTEILRRYSVGGIALSKPTADGVPRVFDELLALAREYHIPVFTLSAGDTLPLPGEATLAVLWPPKRIPTTLGQDLNNDSLVLKLLYGEHRALFTGDIGGAVETTLLAAKTDLRAEVLKVSHHGSRASSSTGFLLAVRPSLAVISVGENTYGHPHPHILKRLQEQEAEVRRTDRDGRIDVEW
jgi:competence protein ComEC